MYVLLVLIPTALGHLVFAQHNGVSHLCRVVSMQSSLIKIVSYWFHSNVFPESFNVLKKEHNLLFFVLTDPIYSNYHC